MSTTPDSPTGRAGFEVANLRIETADLSNQTTRARFLRSNPELLQPQTVSDLSALVPQLIRSDKNTALRAAELAITIATSLGDPEAIAHGLRAKGNALYGLSRNKAAAEHHARALQFFRSTGNRDQAARTLSSTIQPLILLGRYDEAFAAAREAREIFAAEGNLWRLARLELNLGNIFDRLDRVDEAIASYESAYRYLSDHGINDPEAVSAALHNLAVACLRLNDFRKALATYSEARDFAASHQMHALVAQSDYNIASLHYLRGDYSRAISMLRDARETCRASGDDYHFALCHLDLSEIYLELNLCQEAAETAAQASESFRRLGMHYERGKSLINMAIAQGQQGQSELALQLFLRARRILVKERNKLLPSLIDLYRGVVLVDMQRRAEAYRLCLASLTAFRKFKLTRKAIVCRLLMTRIHLQNGEPDLARQQCLRVLKSLLKLESPALSYEAYALLGQIESDLGRESRAYRAYRRALNFLEQLRSRIQGEELKISFMKDRVNIYEALVDLALKTGHTPAALTEAFGYIQRAKSRSLLDTLSTSRSTSWLAPQSESHYAHRVQQLREELNWYFHKIEAMQLEQASQQEIAALRQASRQREQELLKLSREHAPDDREDPEWEVATGLTVDHIRQALPADTVILEYFESKDRFMILLVSHTEMKIVPIAESSQVAALIEMLQFQMAKPNLGAEYVKAFGDRLLLAVRAHLLSLHKLLIEPVRTSLHAKHLVIAPHGVHHNLPFHALFDGDRYLIDEFTISYAPSASIYAVCQERNIETEESSLILGIPDEAVPFVQEEVEAAARYLPQPELRSGENATQESLRTKGQNCRFIHIATHGYFRKDNPLFSGIRLGDSYLSLYDLYQLKLPAELVTLSGCTTGHNVVAAGDELLGLVRGLIHAGAQSSLLTLWDVQDRSTADLMMGFNEALSSGLPKSLSLQKSMQRLREQYPHPYYWAPFVLIGKT